MTASTVGQQDAPNILVVDDTPANLELLSGMLKERNCKIRAAISGELALQAARSDPPDLVLLDINMPGMDGYEVCRRLKADEKLKEIPVIFLSSLDEMKDKVKAFAVGGVDYITKPYQLEEVQARVEIHLTLKAAKEYLKDKNRFLEYTFSRFVSPEVVETMKQKPISELLKMERCELTVLFADLRGFTTLANELTPEEVQETLNSFLEVMVTCVQQGGGLMDKFLGDGFMALFGAPFRQKDHARRALNAAISIQLAHRGWMEKRSAGGLPCRPLGIGLVAGETVVGAYGTHSRMEYTALGHVVNLASRLCGAAEAGEILTTPLTREAAQCDTPSGAGRCAFSFFPKGKMHFKNIQETVEVISIVQEEPSHG
ncbi:MAG: response regulator [Elusimicrobiota bacterium]|nr:response regulator [Elusimicrobiota bacterium]